MSTQLEQAARDALEVWDRPHGINYVDFRPYMDALRAALSDAALERMAENARELGLDYESDDLTIAYMIGFYDGKKKSKPEQSAQDEPVAVDKTTMELAESVGLIGPASRSNDLHGAIQRFHDLICVNATIKAAQMAADVIQDASPPQRQPLTDEQCDAIYNALDAWAREFDRHEFGLPATCGGGMEGGRAIIRAAHGIGKKK